MTRRCDECDCESPDPVKGCGCARCAGYTIADLEARLKEVMGLLGKVAEGVMPMPGEPEDNVKIRRRIRVLLREEHDRKMGHTQL